MKDKTTFCFRKLLNGEILGEIRDEAGIVAASRNLGRMSASDFEKILELVKLAEPELPLATPSVPIELKMS